ncbi:MAG: hypothetical protein KQH63_05985 [Desulfobulbaceae bacterium]|nr:hypothetical protein [Desulfobulbaceae bacterium]
MLYKDKGLLVLGSFYMSQSDAIKKFAEQSHLTFPVGKAKSMARKLRVRTIPEIIFLSREGKITKRIRGKMKPSELIAGIEQIMQ